MTKDHFTKNYHQTQRDVADSWYLIELRKILVRKLLATRTSVSDGIVRGDTTSTILALMGSKWWKEKEEKEEEDMLASSVYKRDDKTQSNSEFRLPEIRNQRVWGLAEEYLTSFAITL